MGIFLDGEANLTLVLTGDFSRKELIFGRCFVAEDLSSFFAERVLTGILILACDSAFVRLGLFVVWHLALDGLEIVTETMEAEYF